MRSAVYFLCTLVLIPLFLSPDTTFAQAVDRDARIAELRPVERDLERFRDLLKEDIRNVETKDENGRSSHVVVQAYHGFGAGTYLVVPRTFFESRFGLDIVLGKKTAKQGLDIMRGVTQVTAAFPAIAREELGRIESDLAAVKKELLALLNTKPGSQAGDNGSAVNIDLTGAWNVTARGNNGKSYTATLRLTKKPDGTYTGSFAWSGSGYSGEEKVTGRLDAATRILTLTGAIAGGNLVPGNYTIEVAQNGRSLDNGIWTGSDGGGKWNAGK